MDYRSATRRRSSTLVRAWLVVAALLGVLVCSAGVRGLHDHPDGLHGGAGAGVCQHSGCSRTDSSATGLSVGVGDSDEHREHPRRDDPCEVCLKLDLAAMSVAVGLRVELIPPVRMGGLDVRTVTESVAVGRRVSEATARGPPRA